VSRHRAWIRPSIRSIEKERCRDVRGAHEKTEEKPVTAETRRNAAFGGTQGWRRSRQDALLPSQEAIKKASQASPVPLCGLRAAGGLPRDRVAESGLSKPGYEDRV